MLGNGVTKKKKKKTYGIIASFIASTAAETENFTSILNKVKF